MQWLTSVLQSAIKPLKWWLVVAAWEQGLRVRLGKTTKRLDPGFHWRIPFLDRAYVQSVRLRVAHASNQSISTKDGVVVTFGLALQYQVCDVVKLYQAVAAVEGVLLYAAVSKAARLISTVESAALDPEKLEQGINAEMPGEEYGLEKVQVSVTTFCTARCYRMITGDSWIGGGHNMDQAENSGEV